MTPSTSLYSRARSREGRGGESMGWRFQPAPGWPPAPEGFAPGPDWAPDPSWPPAPAGWAFWVDEDTGEPYRPPGDEPSHKRPSLWARQKARHEAHVHEVEQKRADKKLEQALHAWRTEHADLERLAAVARRAVAGEDSVHAPLGSLHGGELALWAGAAALIEPHRTRGHYVGGYAGTSVHVAKGLNLRVGAVRGRYEPGTEVQTPVDKGRALVTTRRVTFTGQLKTREWRFDKLEGVDADPSSNVFLIHVSNRQSVSGLRIGAAGPDFSGHLGLALDLAEHGAAAVSEAWEAKVAEHLGKRPSRTNS